MNFDFNFIEPINDESIMSLITFIQNNLNTIDSLTINISSLGGSVNSGITIYNYLKTLPFPITTHNLGEVSSSAILLYLSGSARTASSVSKFMFHPISYPMNGDYTYYSLQETLNNLTADINNYADIINIETANLKKKYDISYYLRNDSLVLNRQSAYHCGIVNRL